MKQNGGVLGNIRLQWKKWTTEYGFSNFVALRNLRSIYSVMISTLKGKGNLYPYVLQEVGKSFTLNETSNVKEPIAVHVSLLKHNYFTDIFWKKSCILVSGGFLRRQINMHSLSLILQQVPQMYCLFSVVRSKIEAVVNDKWRRRLEGFVYNIPRQCNGDILF